MTEPSHRRPLPRAATRALLAAALATLAACGVTRPRPAPGPEVARDRAYSQRYPVLAQDLQVAIDGDTSEWPVEAAALADDEYVYIRFKVEGDQIALQSSDETLALYLDVDGNTLTGTTALPEAPGMGVDAEIRFSPRGSDGRGNGVAVFRHDTRGNRDNIGHAVADFHFAPTFASEWYEARIARSIVLEAQPIDPEPVPMGDPIASPDNPNPTPVTSRRGIIADAGTGQGAGVLALFNEQGALIGASDPFAFALPPRIDTPALADRAIPRRRGDAVRVLSWNVLRASPRDNPEPFARVVRAVEPDVVLVQEWDGADGEALVAWFNEHVGGTWFAVAKPDQGVGIISRQPIIDTDTAPIPVDAGGSNYPVRYVAALVQTPLRDTIVASVNLKCCGSAGGREDIRRLAEAQAINHAFANIAPSWRTTRVIGGDLNLVGSFPPLASLTDDLDEDQSDLEIAAPYVLGDAAVYTWSDPRSAFSPGRLDYLVYSGANADLINAFVLDDARLSDAVLDAAGLERGDTSASDHKPLVIDLRPR